MTSNAMTIGDDSVVSFHYTLRDDAGSITESLRGRSPVVYMHGRNNIVPGLETQLAGKTSGDKFTAVVAPEQGYGLRNDERRAARAGQAPGDARPVTKSARWSSSIRAKAAGKRAS